MWQSMATIWLRKVQLAFLDCVLQNAIEMTSAGRAGAGADRDGGF